MVKFNIYSFFVFLLYMQSVFQSRKPARTIRRRPRTQTGQGIGSTIKRFANKLRRMVGIQTVKEAWEDALAKAPEMQRKEAAKKEKEYWEKAEREGRVVHNYDEFLKRLKQRDFDFVGGKRRKRVVRRRR